MKNGPKREQRRIDVACGYVLCAYIGVTLTWLAMLLLPSSMPFALLTAACAGGFGFLRNLGLAIRFWIIPLASLAYLIAVFFCLRHQASLVAACMGITFSAVSAVPLYKLFKHDFARTIPPWLCQSCGYPLLGLTEPTCPECGKLFDPTQVPDVSSRPADQPDPLQ